MELLLGEAECVLSAGFFLKGGKKKSPESGLNCSSSESWSGIILVLNKLSEKKNYICKYKLTFYMEYPENVLICVTAFCLVH